MIVLVREMGTLASPKMARDIGKDDGKWANSDNGLKDYGISNCFFSHVFRAVIPIAHNLHILTGYRTYPLRLCLGA